MCKNNYFYFLHLFYLQGRHKLQICNITNVQHYAVTMIWDKAWTSTRCYTLLCCYTHSRSQMSYSVQNRKPMNTSKYSKMHFDISHRKLCICYCLRGFQMEFKTYSLEIVLRSSENYIHTSKPYRCEVIAHILHMLFVVVKWLYAHHMYMKVFSFYTWTLFLTIFMNLCWVLLNITAGSLLLYH